MVSFINDEWGPVEKDHIFIVLGYDKRAAGSEYILVSIDGRKSSWCEEAAADFLDWYLPAM